MRKNLKMILFILQNIASVCISFFSLVMMAWLPLVVESIREAPGLTGIGNALGLLSIGLLMLYPVTWIVSLAITLCKKRIRRVSFLPTAQLGALIVLYLLGAGFTMVGFSL